VTRTTTKPVTGGGGAGGSSALDIRASVGTSTSPTNSAPNVLQQTETFDNAAWTKLSGASITANAGIAPNGTSTADRLTLSSGTNNLNRMTQVPTASGTVVLSLYVKKGTQGNRITLYQDGSPFGGAYDFNLDSPTGNFLDVGNGWYRIWFTITWSNQTVSIGSYTSGTNTPGDNFLIWGVQLEPGTTPTTYVAHPVINKDIALPFEAKAFLPFGSLMSATGAATGLNLGLGGLTTSAQSAISVSSITGVTTSNSDRRHDNGDAVSIITDGTVTEEAARSAIAADKVTLNWTTAAATAWIYNHIALGGSNLEVSLVQCQMNGTNAAQSFAHGLSGVPTGVLFFSIGSNGAPPSTTNELRSSIGAWAGGNQFAAMIRSGNGVTTTSTRRSLYTSGCIGSLEAVVRRLASVDSVDATNVNVTYPVTTWTFQDYFWMLCIRGAKCQVGTFDVTSLTAFPISTPGITPKLFLPVFVKDGVDSVGTVLNDLTLTIGASDGTNNVSCGIGDVNGATTTNARRWQDSAKFCERNPSNGNSIFEATAGFVGESVVITPTLNSFSNWGQGAYLLLGS
jgi:hypothetical protein